LIMHAERGSQYASLQYRNLLSAHGINIKGSMSRKGDCWGNAGVMLGQCCGRKLLRKPEKRASALRKLTDTV
jgi:hypothetical protein